MAKISGTEAVRRMRDEFVELVNAYNQMELYTHARDAQRMAILLNNFENKHNLVEMAWPAVVIPGHDQWGPSLDGINGREISAEEL